MARRMEARDDDELALDDKLDVARTLLSLNHRIQLRHEKERVLAAIKQSHRTEVNRGEVTTASVPSGDEILALYAGDAKALEEGAGEDQSKGRKRSYRGQQNPRL